jgi:hypothetical protein
MQTPSVLLLRSYEPLLVQRLYVADHLPDLRIAKLDPGWHSVAAIAVHQQPVELALRRLLLDARRFQGWPFLRAIRVIAVTMSTMVREDTPTCSHRVGVVMVWIYLFAVARRNLSQPRTVRHSGRVYSQRRQNQE